MSEASLPREILHREGFYPEESSGLFVGISSFDDDRFAAVPFAVDDAVDLAWVFALHLKLIDPSRTVLALAGEPRKEISQGRLAALLQAGAKQESAGFTRLHKLVLAVGRASGSRGLFVLTAATHGLSDQGGDYLVAADSGRETLLETGLKLPPLFDRISQLPARRRLVLLDACRERLTEQRSVGEADPAMAASFAAAISRAVGQTVLMGSVAGGYSYDDTKKKNGVFSGALVAGLCGAAQADAEGLIKVGAVAEYAREQVQAFVREHRREHERRSRGIEERYDENARDLPLAIDPARTRALEAYRVRRAAAVEQLHRNIGGDLDGHRFQDITDFLSKAGLPSTEVLELLTEIEALDGSARSKRSVLFLFDRLRPVPVVPPLVSQPAPQPPPPKESSPPPPKESSPPPPVVKSEIRRQPEVPVVPASHSGTSRKWLVGAVLAVLALLLVGWLGFGGGGKKPEQTEQPVAGSSVKLEQPSELIEKPGPPVAKLEQAKEEATGKKPAAEPSVATPKAPEPEPGAVTTDSLGHRYRWVPGGTYTIGSPKSDPERFSSEDQREVSVKGFWLAETEVTQAQWESHGLRNLSRFSTCATCPVESVSWWEAAAFANRLSSKTKLEACYDLEGCKGELGTEGFGCSAVKVKGAGCSGYRLPTEAEWEVAARGRAGGAAYEARYGQLAEIAWYDDNSGGNTHPVGEKQANAWGLEDMLGNVWEWTESAEGSYRVLRGGSWIHDAGGVRAASRLRREPGLRYEALGFRFSLGRPRSGQEREGRGAP